MKNIIFFLIVVIILISLKEARADLYSYLKKTEPDYKWEKIGERNISGGKVYELKMISQKWHEIIWEHNINIIYPDRIEHPQYCTIVNAGDYDKNSDKIIDNFGISVANKCGTIVVVLWDIPNQPLFDGKYEDEIISHTFMKFMETDDESWPLLFPMAKSVIKCMDTVQDFTKKLKLSPVDKFIITGASKRGWTSWMAGASGDKRVTAIIPMVIDMLNMEKQLAHQMEVYGKTSDAIHDYKDAGVLDKFNSKEGKKLIQLVDPYSYRKKLTLPKLIINATNDRYWTVDALNLYWSELKGNKSLLYVPNCGHGLNNIMPVVNTATAFIHIIASGQKFPELKWEFKETKDKIKITMWGDKIISGKLYKASSSNGDFRASKWTFEEMNKDKSGYTVFFKKPTSGTDAIFGEGTYEIDGSTFTLSTQMKVIKSE